MQTLNDRPSTVAGVAQAILIAGLGVLAYYLQMQPQEVLLWTSLVAAACVGIQYWVSQRTQPDSKPVDKADGIPLVRADTFQPSAGAKSAGRTVVKVAPRGAVAGETPTAPVWSK